MSENWVVFITTEENPQSKAANRAFLLIQDFEFSEYPADSRWVLLLSKDLPLEPPPATLIPLPDISSNEFCGTSLLDINMFIRSHEDTLQKLGLSTSNWLVIDQKGLDTNTCIVCDQCYNSGELEDGGNPDLDEGFTNEFRACRIPYERAWSMLANLNIANMGFEDFIDEEAGEQQDGTWKWQPFGQDGESDENSERDNAIQELRDAGQVD